MLNEEIYQKLLEQFGEDRMREFSEMLCCLYEMRASSPPPISDDEYELGFWTIKHIYHETKKEI